MPPAGQPNEAARQQPAPLQGTEGRVRVAAAARVAALHIVERLREQGYLAYFAGGCVRDQLLNRLPLDYDVTTNAHPDAVMRLFPRHSAVGAHFGVVLVHCRDHHEPDSKGYDPERRDPSARGQEYGERKTLQKPERGESPQGAPLISVEVATFRTDLSYSDGRHPDAVQYAQHPEQDVVRRDFTINGLLQEPVSGEVLDFVGGRADLQAGLVRAIGDPAQRFREDRLRMLRAVRFAARFGFRIEERTFAAIQAAAAEIHCVSQERIRDELLKMLTEGHARAAFELLDRAGLLEQVLPEVADMKGVQQPPEYHPEGDVWTHTCMMLEGLPEGVAPTLALGVLLHDVGKPPTFRVAPDRIRFDRHAEVGALMAEKICQRLRMAREQCKQVCELVRQHMKFADVERMKQSTLKRFMRQKQFDEHLELHRLDCLMSHGHLRLYEFVRNQLKAAPAEAMRPPRLIDGRDLLELGYQPGPDFRRILEAVEDAQLEGELPTRAAALEFVHRRFPKHPSEQEA